MGQKLVELLILVGGAKVVWMVMDWALAKWLKPALDKKPNVKATVSEVAAVADEITDVLRDKYPDAKWDDYLDDAVDTIIKALDLKPDTAVRAARAAIARKKAAEKK